MACLRFVARIEVTLRTTLANSLAAGLPVRKYAGNEARERGGGRAARPEDPERRTILESSDLEQVFLGG